MNEKPNENETEAGLVIYDKTDRSEVYEHAFPSPQAIHEAIHEFPNHDFDQQPPTVAKHYISLSPASVRVSKKSLIQATKSSNYQPRKQIKAWSKKSRSNMVAVLCSLDYSPMFENGDIPALITLTYPKNFRALASTAKVATRHLKLFRQRYERAFGKIRAIYKWEFMRSGSPHVHIFMVPPNNPTFKTWLSNTWADIVGETDPAEHAKHVKAGTAVDYGKALRSTDPKRIAVYFSKHSSPNSHGAKEYQNQPPDFWVQSGSVGRFWGRWGLESVVATKEVSEQQAVFIARVLRKWSKANNKPRKVHVWRVRIKTGVVYQRKVFRRNKRMKKTQGFCSVNDGSTMGKQLARALEARFVSGKN